ncbi:MAG: DUF1491 family protein [Erythrobacter sp.]|nr:DUF1491 family protein [Erythrobacter sp.]RZV35680.1 MAG: DUF1491 family protein [Sphingomonadaceae bacterium]
MVDSRLPAHVEISAIIRLVQAEGGFATVIAKGERDAGTILLIVSERGQDEQLLERMPNLEGTRPWSVTRKQDIDNASDFAEYVDKRRLQDSDVWILEADVADRERFIESLAG